MLDGVFKLFLSDDLVERAAGTIPSPNGLEARSTRPRCVSTARRSVADRRTAP